MTEPTAFPLCWPEGHPRARSREAGSFQTTLPRALDNVETSLRLFGQNSGKAVAKIVMSSNVTLGQNNPADPGVAVWFLWDGMSVCIPVDRYTKTAANLQAIHHIIEARRTELRHGTLALVRASFQGFKALPPPPGAKRWHEVLELPPTASLDEVESAFKRLAIERHPDRTGGDNAPMAQLNAARAAAKKEIAQ